MMSSKLKSAHTNNPNNINALNNNKNVNSI